MAIAWKLIAGGPVRRGAVQLPDGAMLVPVVAEPDVDHYWALHRAGAIAAARPMMGPDQYRDLLDHQQKCRPCFTSAELAVERTETKRPTRRREPAGLF